MNMDYSKAFELLNQDAEKERNKKAEKAVHDNLYNKGFRDGIAILDKIRAEIETKYGQCDLCVYFVDYDYNENDISEYRPIGDIADILQIIDKYKAESEDAEAHPINENITKGFEEFTKMMFRQGQEKREVDNGNDNSI